MRQPQFRKGKAMETKLAKDEEIAMLRVLKKRIDERLKDIEGSEKDELIKLYDECGIDRKQVKIGDEPVGSISITMSKPKPYIDPIKKASALAYLEAKGLTEEPPAKGWEDHFAQAGANVIDCDTGEIVSFLLWEPARPKAVRTVIKESEAVNALRPILQGATVAGLIG